MKLRFTPSGRIQFLKAVSYILRDNPQAAIKFRKRAEHALRRLTQYPKSGRLIPEFPDLPLREVIVPPYRFFTVVRAGPSGWSHAGTEHNWRRNRRRKRTSNKPLKPPVAAWTMRPEARDLYSGVAKYPGFDRT